MAQFLIGELVTYYPAKKAEDDNRHWPAEVLEVRGERYRVKIHAPPPASHSDGHRTPPCPATAAFRTMIRALLIALALALPAHAVEHDRLGRLLDAATTGSARPRRPSRPCPRASTAS